MPRIQLTARYVGIACVALSACTLEDQNSSRGGTWIPDTVVRVETVTVVAAPRTDIPAPLAPPAVSRATDAPQVTVSDVTELTARRLAIPVAGVVAARLPDTFSEMRGSRPHAALDIPAPRGTPVISVDDGRVLKLFASRAGGLTLYVADPTERFIYYYAHLDSYEPSLREGAIVRKGDRIGAVGTTGNAPPNVPHLHFAIMRTHDVRKWSEGTALDPRPIFLSAPR